MHSIEAKDIIIREAQPRDAKAFNQYLKDTYEYSDHLITKPAEFRIGPWRQRHRIAKKLTNPTEICLVAVSGNVIVGTLENWTDRRKRVTHSTCFSMSVDFNWRGKHIGKNLLTHFITWVKSHSTLERIELHVHSDNKAAIQLYESCGFEEEGIRRQAIKYEDGRIIDDKIMALWP